MTERNRPSRATTKIGSVCEVNPPKPKIASLPDETQVMFIPMAAVDDVTGSVVGADIRTLGEMRFKSYRTFAPGDVLFAKITPCMENGKSAVVPDIPSGLGFGSTEFHVLRPGSGVNPRFIWHYVRQPDFRRDAREHMTGSVGQLRVPVSYVEDATLALPPREMQDQVVDLLDAVMASGHSSARHMINARHAIARLRQSILGAACSGRLTSNWRGAARRPGSADSIVAAIANSRTGRPVRHYKPSPGLSEGDDLPEGWCWTAVGALVDVATGATPLRARSDYYNGTIPWVTSGAVNAGTIVEASQFITDLAIRETNAKIFPAGTLLIAMYGEGQTRGRVAELAINAATNQALAALLFDEHSARLRPYLRLFLLENYERIRLLAFGGVQPNLSLGVIRDTVVPLPPFDEQAEIIRRVDQLLSIADKVMHGIEAALQRVDRGSQAILAKGFRGELVTDERGDGL